jgi:transposase
MRLRFSLKIDRVKGRAYARLVRSVRHGRHVRPVTLYQIGRVTEDQIARIRTWLNTDPTLPADPTTLFSDLNHVHIRRSWQYGREALAHFVWRKLGLHTVVIEALGDVPRKGKIARWVETMVINRLAEPTSKYGLLDWLSLSATPYLLEFGNTPLHENLFYRAMDRLLRRQDTLERLIYERVVRPLTSETAILYHDLTSTYCEGEVTDFVRFGHNRDQVEGCPQVNWGMVVTPEGFPITLQVYPGNTTDVTTVVGMRERLEQVFRLHQGIYVGDRGMISTDVEKDLTVHGFQWILAEKNDDIEGILETGSQAPVVAVSDRNEVREYMDPKGRRHVLLLNEERRKEILEVLKIRQAQGKAIIERVRRGWAKRPDRAPHAVLRQAMRELSEKGLTDLFEVDVDDHTVQGVLTRTKDKVRRLEKWAGWWVLTTNTDLPVEEVAARYLGLAVIERGWRELKGVLKVRPFRHRLEGRIRGHLLICELAYLVDRYIDWQVTRAKLQEGGIPVSGARAVEMLGSVTVNETELATTGLRRLILTDLQPMQEEVLETVGVDSKVFQRGWGRLD